MYVWMAGTKKLRNGSSVKLKQLTLKPNRLTDNKGADT
jgi:hypothetical protein